MKMLNKKYGNLIYPSTNLFLSSNLFLVPDKQDIVDMKFNNKYIIEAKLNNKIYYIKK